jgi:hypothetical protein
MDIRFKRFLCVDSAKAIKALGFDHLNGINYMAPHESAGVGNLCSHASIVCIDLCLGRESGRAAMADSQGNYKVRQSREAKARYFMKERKAYMSEFAVHCAHMIRRGKKVNLTPVVRPNGSTDVAFEMVRFHVSSEFAAMLSKISGETIKPGVHTIMGLFPMLQFVDYTKNPLRFNRKLPDNYYLTFSRSEVNEADCLALLARGVNVAVIFAGAFPESWHGFPVINGDLHDLRHLDPRGGYVVGLSPKGHKAKRDKRGFVVRNAA